MMPVNSVNSDSQDYREEPITVYENNIRQTVSEAIIIEEPLSIRIDGSPYSLVMRSPGDEKAHVAGFCLSEGIIDHSRDMRDLSFCTEDGVNVATVSLTRERKEKIADILDRKGFISQTSCGICGKEMAEDIRQILTSAPNNCRFSTEELFHCINLLPQYQRLYRKTRSAHAAMIFDKDLNPLAFAEDVGRHNALDKAIGQVVLDQRLPHAVFGAMSSRLSYELVQKSARARLELLIGISRPTALAIDLARSVNMTLACTKNQKLMIFCGEDRVFAG